MSNALTVADPKTPTTPDAERIWSCLLSRGTLSEKIASRQLAANDLPPMRLLLAEEQARCAPATFMGRAGLLEALFQHYPAMPVGDGLKQFLKDWHEDVGHLPAQVLADACRSYRRSKAQYRPTPGMLLEHVDRDWRVRLTVLERAIAMLEAADNGVDKARASV